MYSGGEGGTCPPTPLPGQGWRGRHICTPHYIEYPAQSLLQSLLPLPQLMPSFGTLLPVTYTFLNLAGSLVCYSFSIAGVGLSCDEWFIMKVAQG